MLLAKLFFLFAFGFSPNIPAVDDFDVGPCGGGFPGPNPTTVTQSLTETHRAQPPSKLNRARTRLIE